MQQSSKQIRKCIVTGENHLKTDMIRIVSFKGGDIEIDLKGKKDGRGCYVSVNYENIDKLCKNNGQLLARALKKRITSQEIDYLKQNLPKAFAEKEFRNKETKKVTLRIRKNGNKEIV